MIKFRPHHFLCAFCFQGEGYSPQFVNNFTRIMGQLNAPGTGDLTQIKVVGYTDSICSPCPHKRNQYCVSEDKIVLLDKAHAAALKLQPGEVITWGAAKQRIAQNVTLQVFHNICSTCNWKKLGICEQVLVA